MSEYPHPHHGEEHHRDRRHGDQRDRGDREPVLRLHDVQVKFRSDGRSAHALRGIDLELREREVHGLVGESGAGKSVLLHTLLNLNRGSANVETSGSVIYKGRDLLTLFEPNMRKIRGAEISIVFQEPAKHLNPGLTIGGHIEDLLRYHRAAARRTAGARTAELLDLVELPRRVLKQYAFELSGGMQQRAMIAIAIACNPLVLLADEPTTALDVTVQRQILELLLRLRAELGLAVLFVSHDLGVVHEIADRVSVLYSGRVVEEAPNTLVFSEPLHPYTELLLRSVPSAAARGRELKVIPGAVPDASAVPPGCAFHPRCPIATELCTMQVPQLERVRDDHRVACFHPGELAAGESEGGSL